MIRRRRWLGFIGLILIMAGLFRLAKMRDFQVMGKLVHRVQTSSKRVALTFDDGPDPRNTPQLLDVLDAHGAKATFFAVGLQLQKHPQLARSVLERGHELANHSFSHPRMVLRSPSFIRDELDRTDALIRRAGAKGPILFRAPYGKKLFALPWVLARSGRINVLFDVVPEPGDYTRPPPKKLVESVMAQLKPGSIVVLHDGGGPRAETVEAVRRLLPMLQARGYAMVTVSQLMSEAEGAPQ